MGEISYQLMVSKSYFPIYQYGVALITFETPYLKTPRA